MPGPREESSGLLPARLTLQSPSEALGEGSQLGKTALTTPSWEGR